MSVRVDMKDEVSPYLERISEEKRAKALRSSTTAGAKAAAPILAAETPVGKTGNLRGAVRHKAMKKRYGIGSVVAPMGPKAAHRHLVMFGTKPHYIPGPAGGFLSVGDRYLRGVHHPGAKANPFVDRAASAMQDAADAAFTTRIEKFIDTGDQPHE